MKKKLTVFLTTMMLCICAVCSASDGTDLDTEEKYVNLFFAGKDYPKVAAFMDPQLAKNVTEEQYKALFERLNRDLGKLASKKLRVCQVFDDGQILHYAAAFEKAKDMRIVMGFKKEGNKITLMDFRVVDPNAKAPETPAKK